MTDSDSSSTLSSAPDCLEPRNISSDATSENEVVEGALNPRVSKRKRAGKCTLDQWVQRGKKTTNPKKNQPVPADPAPRIPPNSVEGMCPYTDELTLVAYIVMFRTKFAPLFEGTPSIGPQDIEDGITSEKPSEIVLSIMVRLISLALNRKRHVEVGQHKRAFQEVIHLNWRLHPAKSWINEHGDILNPFYGERSFSDVDWEQKLIFLRLLVDWALINSEAVRKMIDDEYSGPRHSNDQNVKISVQPLGEDYERRRYWMIRGDGDAQFRTYREQVAIDGSVNFCSIAGDSHELSELISNQLQHTSRSTKHLREKLESMLPELLENEGSRGAREYQKARKIELAARVPIQPTVTTRTRGRRINYATMDEQGNESDTDKRTLRASTRSQIVPVQRHSSRSLHGRRLRAPRHGEYGEALHSNFSSSDDEIQRSLRLNTDDFDVDGVDVAKDTFYDHIMDRDTFYPSSDSLKTSEGLLGREMRVSAAAFVRTRERHNESKEDPYAQAPVEKAYNYYQRTIPCYSLNEYLMSSASSNLKSLKPNNMLKMETNSDISQPHIPDDFLGSGAVKNVLLCMENFATQAQHKNDDQIEPSTQNQGASNLANGGHLTKNPSTSTEVITPIPMEPEMEVPTWLPPRMRFAV